MHKGRLEAFSDGVFAIIITILVLEIKVPESAELSALTPMLPVFVSYVLSFVYLGIYWNNHHHLLQAAHNVDGRILWANLHLLFWLSLCPFATAWMGENHFAPIPVALYGFDLFMAAISYTILVRFLLALHGRDSTLAKAIGSDIKGNISLVIYVSAIALTFVNAYISLALYFLVAAIWFIPDRRIEKRLAK
jgi:uncharacterized membrane protein